MMFFTFSSFYDRYSDIHLNRDLFNFHYFFGATITCEGILQSDLPFVFFLGSKTQVVFMDCLKNGLPQ